MESPKKPPNLRSYSLPKSILKTSTRPRNFSLNSTIWTSRSQPVSTASSITFSSSGRSCISPATSTASSSISSSTNSTSSSDSSSHPSLPNRSLVDLARRLAVQGPVKTLETPRRIRILFNGAMIADTLGTSGALYVWEHDYYPQYYLPLEAFVQPANFNVHLAPGSSIEDSSGQIIGGALKLSVKRTESPDSDYKHLTDMVLFAADLSGHGKVLCNMVKVRFDAVGQWFEEDTPIYVHPKDPFKRVDILQCSRPVRVLVNEVVVAESQTSMHLYETSLPPRYYLPLTAVDTAVLRPSTTRSLCPYKGEAQYHSVAVKGEVYRDLVWFYTRTTPECCAIAGLCCFWNEKEGIDVEFWDNGEWRREKRPRTHFV